MKPFVVSSDPRERNVAPTRVTFTPDSPVPVSAWLRGFRRVPLPYSDGSVRFFVRKRFRSHATLTRWNRGFCDWRKTKKVIIVEYAYWCPSCGCRLSEGPSGGGSVNSVCRACRINWGCMPDSEHG